MKDEQDKLKWFAARMIRERSYVPRYLDHEGIAYSCIADIRSLIFIHTTDSRIQQVRYDLYDKMLVYRDAEKMAPQAIPDSVMNTFLLMAPFHDEPVIYLSVDDPAFFDGPVHRVKNGVFKGCEGVIRRIKGTRRLIVKVSDHAAIATPYIPQEKLEVLA